MPVRIYDTPVNTGRIINKSVTNAKLADSAATDAGGIMFYGTDQRPDVLSTPTATTWVLAHGGTATIPAWARPIFHKSYFAGTASWPTATTLITLAHGLATEPSIVQVYFRPRSATGNYATSDLIPYWGHQADGTYGAGYAMTVSFDDTNIRISRGNAADDVVLINDRTSGAAFTMQATNWNYVVKAWV